MKYYIVFINKLDGFKVVVVASYDDYDEQQKAIEKYNRRLSTYGFDWLGIPQVEYHEIQAISEVSWNGTSNP